jgi:hypothetical protein
MASEPTYPKGQTWGLAALMALFAAAAAIIALMELLPLSDALVRGDTVIALWPMVLGCVPLVILFLSFAVMLLLSLRPGRESLWIRRCWLAAIISLVAVPIAPWLGKSIVDARLSGQGYQRCPAIFERPVKTRWARLPERCPR